MACWVRRCGRVMSDLMPHESAPVDTFREGDWDSAMVERAYQLWCIYGHSGTRVAFVLEREALIGTEDGAPIPVVPSAQTINGWARERGWEKRELVQLAEELPKRVLDLQVAKLTLAERAIETLRDLDAGLYDALDPRIASTKSKTAVEVLKMIGLGTFGANQGGLSVPQAQELMIALGEQAGEEHLSEKEKSRRNREAIAASKRGE